MHWFFLTGWNWLFSPDSKWLISPDANIYGNSLAYYDENLDLLSELREEICSKIRNGAVDDLASKKLKQIREQIIKCEEQMKQKASRYAKKIYRCCDRVRGIEYGG